MTRSVLALALVGLGVVQALPASRNLEERQSLGGGWGSITPVPTESPAPCQIQSPPTTEFPPCILSPPITGGMNPPKEKRQGWFGLGTGSPSGEREKAIAALELQLLALKNKPNPTEDDLAQIESLEEMLLYAEGITSISAPPGVNTTLTHANRKRFTLPPDAFTDTKKAIDELEVRLEQLQNQRQKSVEDMDEMKDILDALSYLGGITSISAPPGTISTFHPGKRQAIGGAACELVETLGFEEALAALFRRYGPPSRAPPEIAQQEMYLIYVIQQCAPYFGGGSGSGGEITPVPTYPGGTITPEPTYPGGGITPVPVHPGGPMEPVPVYSGSPMEPVPSQPGGEIVPVPVYPGSPMEPVPSQPGGEIVPVPVYPGSPMEPASR